MFMGDIFNAIPEGQIGFFPSIVIFVMETTIEGG